MKFFILFIWPAIYSLGISSSAWAGLGGGADLPPLDQQSALVRTAAPITSDKGSFSVQEVKTPSADIREFLNKNGIVFAVAWNGISHPNFSHYFGRYWLEFNAGKKFHARQSGKRHQRTQTQNMILETSGHMRAVVGRAYIPNLLPPDFKIEDIQ